MTEKLELCEGLSVQLDRIIHAMYVTRQQYRQGAIPKLGVLRDLVAEVGVLADAETVRSGLKTVGLTDSAPKRAYGVSRFAGEVDEPPALESSDDEGDRRSGDYPRSTAV